MIMTLETFPAEDVDPLVSSVHPCMLHVVRMGPGKRLNFLEPVPTKRHWRQVFDVLNGKVLVVNSTSELDVEKDGTKRNIPTRGLVTEMRGDSIILGSGKEHLNLVFLKPKKSSCDATINKILMDRLNIENEEEVTKYTSHFTGKKGCINMMRIRLKVSFYNESGHLISSSVSPQTVVDNGSKNIGCMDMYDAWPRRSCSHGGRKIMMISEYELADDVEPVFEVYDAAGNQRPSVEELLVQPKNSASTMTIKNTTIIFLTPAQPHLRRIKESIGDFHIKLLARRRSDGFTSKAFDFHYKEHNENCDHKVDTEDGEAKIESQTRAKPKAKKRKMQQYDRSLSKTVVEQAYDSSPSERSSPSPQNLQTTSEFTPIAKPCLNKHHPNNQRPVSPPRIKLEPEPAQANLEQESLLASLLASSSHPVALSARTPHIMNMKKTKTTELSKTTHAPPQKISSEPSFSSQFQAIYERKRPEPNLGQKSVPTWPEWSLVPLSELKPLEERQGVIVKQKDGTEKMFLTAPDHDNLDYDVEC